MVGEWAVSRLQDLVPQPARKLHDILVLLQFFKRSLAHRDVPLL